MSFTPVTDPSQIRKIFLVAKNLQCGTTAQELSDHLLSTIGLDISPEKITCKDVSRSFANGFCEIDSNVLATFLNMCLESVHVCGANLVQFEPKKWHNNKQRS